MSLSGTPIMPSPSPGPLVRGRTPSWPGGRRSPWLTLTGGQFAAEPRRPRSRTPQPETLLQPLTEGQFAAVVRGFEVSEAEDGSTVYTRDGYPWMFIRTGDRVVAKHRWYDLPAEEYTILSA